MRSKFVELVSRLFKSKIFNQIKIFLWTKNKMENVYMAPEELTHLFRSKRDLYNV